MSKTFVALYGYVPKRVEMLDPPGEGLIVHIHPQQEPKRISDIEDQPANQDQHLTVRMSLRED